MDVITLFVNAIDHWRDAKGIGTALIPPPLTDKAMILGVLQKVYSKSPDTSTVIVTSNFEERGYLIEYLTHQEDEENNLEFRKLLDEKTIKILTTNFVDKPDYNYIPKVMILYHIRDFSEHMKTLLIKCKFKLVVIDRLLQNPEDSARLYSVCPLLTDFEQNQIDALRISTPVEEIRIPVSIPENSEDERLLKYYDEYISTSVNIFGSFDNLNLALRGDDKMNISAMSVCESIAYENGWNEHLDMSVELNVQIDSLYNPNSIRDRASTTYELIRTRSQFVSDYKLKLEEILRIVQEHSDERILIINKRGEFAAKVTEFLNNMSDANICGNYHDSVESVPATDIYGNPLYVKSGKLKGQRRMLASKGQRTLNEAKFNRNIINVLSTSNTPDKTLCVPIDVIIITSPLCEDIESYIYRLSNVTYPNGKITLYSLYVKNSVEEKQLQNKQCSGTHTILNEPQKNVKIENNCDFVIAD